jgi:hypothetical protein
MRFRLSALAAVAFALAAPAFAQLPMAVPDDVQIPAMPMPPMQGMQGMGGMAPGPVAGVRKITDGALTCEQLYAESMALEQSMARHRTASDAAQQEANVAQEAMMKGARGSMAAPMATSVLSMIPGVGMFSGLAAQASMQAQMSSMQESTQQMTASYQRMAQAQEQLGMAQARNDHLVGLFLAKNCKLPEAPAKP